MTGLALAEQRPLAELNTTPLIDVLLVLLILFVITMPAATHVLELPLPQGDATHHPINADRNTVTIAPDGTIAWNGGTVSQSELAGLLAATTRLRPEPELRFAPDGQAPYADAAETLRTIKLSGVTAFGFVGTDRFADFGRAGR